MDESKWICYLSIIADTYRFRAVNLKTGYMTEVCQNITEVQKAIENSSPYALKDSAITMDKQTDLVDSVLFHIKGILETMTSEDLQNIKEAYAKVSGESEQQRYDNILTSLLRIWSRLCFRAYRSMAFAQVRLRMDRK